MKRVEQATIKNYWKDKLPGLRHSDDEVGTKSFF